MSTPLVRAHLLGERRLRETTTEALARIWHALPGHDRGNLAQWLSEALPLVEAAQKQSVALTNAYVARSLERQPFGVDTTKLIGAETRNGTPPPEVYERPFITLWSELGEGVAWTDAARAAAARAGVLAATDVQLSMRDTLGAIQEIEPRILGWERVTNPGACDFCQQVNGAFVYGGSEPMPLHANCGCSAVPVTSEGRGKTPLPKGVAIAQHGELGPVLVDPSQHFMGEAEALAR